MRFRHRTIGECAATLLAMILTAGCSSGAPITQGSPVSTSHATRSANQSARLSVAIRGYAFDPAKVTISAGGTITFHNDDTVAHTATAPNGAFDTGTIAPGKSVTVHLAAHAKGTIHYICDIHQFMTATVNVAP